MLGRSAFYAMHGAAAGTGRRDGSKSGLIDPLAGRYPSRSAFLGPERLGLAVPGMPFRPRTAHVVLLGPIAIEQVRADRPPHRRHGAAQPRGLIGPHGVVRGGALHDGLPSGYSGRVCSIGGHLISIGSPMMRLNR